MSAERLLAEPVATPAPGALRSFLAILGRDLRLILRHGSEAATALAFFLLAVLLFPFGLGPEPDLLARIAAGILWVVALLASLIALDRLFAEDFQDGSLEQLALAPLPLPLVVLAKLGAHWLATGLPMVILAPLLALMLHMDPAGLPALVGSLLLGTPCLSFIGAVGAALVLGARRGALLLPLLILPLYIPVLIFGTAAIDAALSGLSPAPHLQLLGAILLVSLGIGPFAAAAAAKQALG
ncbi:heme exporter protein B [Hypericibacter adhaerens]|jgi:heme exporter protein B|uniref:Heme exporter protein B n=1 Tax=Hypericibacter adhaerens TaxID=2602016 RepID=A0A5J6N517_9PROT|nr:heme exporter protein B [Hypericibacter adhaerens]